MMNFAEMGCTISWLIIFVACSMVGSGMACLFALSEYAIDGDGYSGHAMSVAAACYLAILLGATGCTGWTITTHTRTAMKQKNRHFTL